MVIYGVCGSRISRYWSICEENSLLAVICLILVQYTNSKREKVLFKPQRTSKATLIKSVSGRPPGWDYFTDLLGRFFFS